MSALGTLFDRPARFDRVASHTGGLGFVAALLVGVASLGGIFDPATYARESPTWRLQAIGQDWIDLAIVTPWLLACAALVARGSRRALLPLAGGFAYLAYTFAIYAFDVRFNALFLFYVAIFGVSVWGLGITLLRGRLPAARAFTTHVPRRTVAGFLVGTGVAFALLWLAGDARALIRGGEPAELAGLGLATNPIHVLDLALVLPAFVAIGIAVLRRRQAATALAAVALAFTTLMALTVGGVALAAGAASPLPAVFALLAAGAMYLHGAILRALPEA
jgi:hypothetical protein